MEFEIQGAKDQGRARSIDILTRLSIPRYINSLVFATAEKEKALLDLKLPRTLCWNDFRISLFPTVSDAWLILGVR